MSELEDKINSLLSSPAEMEKIMGLAKSLSGSFGISETTHSQEKDESSSPGMPFGDIDPKIMKLITRLFSEYNSAANDKTALMNAVKPYLKEERRAAIDRAVQIARLTHIAKIAFNDFPGDDP